MAGIAVALRRDDFDQPRDAERLLGGVDCLSYPIGVAYQHVAWFDRDLALAQDRLFQDAQRDAGRLQLDWRIAFVPAQARAGRAEQQRWVVSGAGEAQQAALGL